MHPAVPSDPALPVATETLAEAGQRTRQFLLNQHAPNTRRAYVSDCRAFTEWCSQNGLQALPATPQTVALYLSHRASNGLSVSSVARHRAAIRFMHNLKGMPSPTDDPLVMSTLKGMYRTLGRPPAKKAPIIDTNLHEMLDHIDPSTLQGMRDRALLLVGFSGSFRRSELAGICVEHLTWTAEGVTVLLPRSKTDQDGRGQTVAIPNGQHLRPVKALREWLAASGITQGPVFRGIKRNGKPRDGAITPAAIARMVKKYAEAAGLNPAMFSGHSLRSGFVTTAFIKGADVLRVMDVTRHKRVETVKGYKQIADQFQNHAGQGFL